MSATTNHNSFSDRQVGFVLINSALFRKIIRKLELEVKKSMRWIIRSPNQRQWRIKGLNKYFTINCSPENLELLENI